MNFVLGTPAEPTTDLDSEIYQWRDGRLVLTEIFPTTGATDAAVLGTIIHMMIATFFLTGLDISRRIISWFREQEIDWSRAMVVIAGKQGRPTAGVTWNTSTSRWPPSPPP
ncbi:hypothetical protein ACIRVK_40055 [Streptomyces sp. NPDC101152]|uniref:hypothetical protein n=1 Tax=Streptomyces sp. NPDC101152 TaxID=3366116 RepID=UPI0038057BD9